MSALPATMICPNPSCPWRKKHANPAEYRAGQERCSDCGAVLVPGAIAPAPAREAPPPITRKLALRIAWTLAIPVALGAASFVPLPGIDQQRLQEASPGRFGGLLTLGIMPLLSGFMIVELLSIGSRRRNGGPSDRAVLVRRALAVAAALALFQAWMITVGFERVPGPSLHVAGPLFGLSMLGGFALVVLAGGWISRAGVVDGFALLACAGVAPALWAHLGYLRDRAAFDVAMFAAAIAAPVAATVFLLPRGRKLAGIVSPPSGTVPLTAALGLTATLAAVGAIFPSLRMLSVSLRPATRMHEGLVALATLLLIPPFTLAFNPRKSLERFGGIPANRSRQILRRGMLLAVGYLAVVHVVPLLFAGPRVLVTAPVLAIATAVALDAFEEISARRRLGDLVSAWPVHRIYAVEPAQELLRKNGIESHARSYRFRTLTQFFGPYAPVHLLVPPSKAADAGKILGELLLGLPPPSGT